MTITFDYTAAMGQYDKSTISTDAETTLLDDQQYVGNQRGAVIYFHSTKAGTMKIYFIDRDNNDVQLQSAAISASQLAVIDFDYHVPRYKITYTHTDAGQTSTTWCEVFAYGASR